MTNLEIVLVVLSLVFAGAALWFGRQYLVAKAALLKAEALSLSQSQMSETFKNLAQSALQGNAEHFLNLAKGTLEKESALAHKDLETRKIEIEKNLEPIKTLLQNYQQNLAQIEKERQRSYVQVETELKRIHEMGITLTNETSALKNALKKPNVRGRWGEVQLRNCVELAGMSEFADVTFQDLQQDTDGKTHIPDMTVRMPGGRVVIVDAKTPIDAFLSALEATDDTVRTAELTRHARHIKEHIKNLSKRAYADSLKNSADFTVMFLPNESFLYAALETQPDIVELALQQKVLIATPPTLIGLLKVIRYGWNEQKLAENAQRISEAGAELHKRIFDFIEAFTGIGKHLEKAQAEYQTGLSRLQSRVLPKARDLEKLGAKSAKTLQLSGTEEIDV
jgi:DNA recombination protein RmuC